MNFSIRSYCGAGNRWPHSAHRAAFFCEPIRTISPKGTRLMTNYDTQRLNDVRGGVLYIAAMALTTNILLALILWRLW
jgi:hypothetical protein